MKSNNEWHVLHVFDKIIDDFEEYVVPLVFMCFLFDLYNV